MFFYINESYMIEIKYKCRKHNKYRSRIAVITVYNICFLNDILSI